MKKEKNGFSINSLKVTLVNLGCDKNRVDAERMLYKLINMGFKLALEVKTADLIIVNTCSFIESAIVESENTISETIRVKKPNAKLIITGCYAQRFFEKAKELFPESDLILKLDQNESLESYVYKLYNQEEKEIKKDNLDRVLSTPSHYAFLKISDGCNNFCSYCTIPFIRGRYKSEPLEKLKLEAEALAEKGVKELILIAQDVTRYGQDLYGKPELVKLIKELSNIEKIECIRLHYCYPEMVTDELIEEIVVNPKVAKYLDIPLQHISDNVLKAMNRRGDSQTIKTLIGKLKEKNITVRSTFIVGFPTETKKDFKELVEFLKQTKLNYVGFFAYSKEENTKAAQMEQVPDKEKQRRLKIVQGLQTKILKANQKKQTGLVVKAVCDKYIRDGVYELRAFNSSPEVDTLIYVYSERQLEIGNYYVVKIKKQIGIDLEGVIV
ncbi:MAG: 30S ribosomal protein S12 methylthiotransferase RimO [Clostridia bacterium]|nr:30S ribosomal protein S12 methylthiotransferase RimO [Clostridia bacterium]